MTRIDVGPATVTDEELTAEALAADPETPVRADAVDFWDLTGSRPKHAFGDWYMASAAGGTRLVRGWRRNVVLLVILAFLVIDAYGLCNTYGWVAFG